MSNVLEDHKLAWETAKLFVTDREAFKAAVYERMVTAIAQKLLSLNHYDGINATVAHAFDKIVRDQLNNLFNQNGQQQYPERIKAMLTSHVEAMLAKAEKDHTKWIRPIADDVLAEFRKDYRNHFMNKLRDLAQKQADKDASELFTKILREL